MHNLNAPPQTPNSTPTTRTPLQRACDLATALAEESGHLGEYVISRADEAVYWTDGKHADCVAYICRDGDLIVPQATEVEHEPFAMACEIRLDEQPMEGCAPDTVYADADRQEAA